MIGISLKLRNYLGTFGHISQAWFQCGNQRRMAVVNLGSYAQSGKNRASIPRDLGQIWSQGERKGMSVQTGQNLKNKITYDTRRLSETRIGERDGRIELILGTQRTVPRSPKCPGPSRHQDTALMERTHNVLSKTKLSSNDIDQRASPKSVPCQLHGCLGMKGSPSATGFIIRSHTTCSASLPRGAVTREIEYTVTHHPDEAKKVGKTVCS